MNILHLSFDYPDSFNPNKTVAIKYLVESSKQYVTNTVISMNRVSKLKEQVETKEDENLYMINSFGFPRGILFNRMLEKFWVKTNKILIENNNYDLVHAHKLTYEGYLAYKIHNKYNIDFIVTIRASDFKILKYKPGLISIYKEILEKTKKIIVLSQWMINELKKYFGIEFIQSVNDKIYFLPNFVECKEEYSNLNNGRYILVMKITKRNIKVKNLDRTLKAISQLKNKNVINLDIIGDGEGVGKLKKLISKYDLENQVKLLGSKDNKQVLDILSKYKALIMCSYPETFGLVYIEALKKGIPIIYCKDSGVYGIFEEFKIGEYGEHSSVESIKNAIIKMETKYKEYKENVQKLQQNGKLVMFKKENISKKYLEIIGIKEG